MFFFSSEGSEILFSPYLLLKSSYWPEQLLCIPFSLKPYFFTDSVYLWSFYSLPPILKSNTFGFSNPLVKFYSKMYLSSTFLTLCLSRRCWSQDDLLSLYTSMFSTSVSSLTVWIPFHFGMNFEKPCWGSYIGRDWKY